MLGAVLDADQVRCLLDRPQLRRWRSDDAPGSPVALLGASVLAQHQQQGASQERAGSGQSGHDPGGRLGAASSTACVPGIAACPWLRMTNRSRGGVRRLLSRSVGLPVPEAVGARPGALAPGGRRWGW